MFRLHAKWKTKQWKLWLKITFSIIKNEGLGCRGTDISSWYCRDDSIEEIENITNAFVAVLVISNIFNFLFSPLSANGFSKSMVKTLQKCSWTSMKPETNLRPYQTSTIDFFLRKLWTGFTRFTIFAKNSVTYVWQGPLYPSAYYKKNYKLWGIFRSWLLYCKKTPWATRKYQTNKSMLKVCTKEKSQIANTRINQQCGVIRFWFYY